MSIIPPSAHGWFKDVRMTVLFGIEDFFSEFPNLYASKDSQISKK
jgi:hypothetical protein